MSMLFIVPAEAAPTLSGATWANAPKHTSAMRWLTSTLPAPTATGGSAANSELGSVIIRTGRIVPPLAGMDGSVALRNAKATQLSVTARTALALPRTAGAVPVKSNVISSPAMVSERLIVLGFCWSGAGP